MGNEVTLNVRFPGEMRDLKARGDAVLARAGVSTSQAIRRLYQHLDETQTVPSWLAKDEDIFEQRRIAMREFVGIAPLEKDTTPEDLKAERLSRLEF